MLHAPIQSVKNEGLEKSIQDFSSYKEIFDNSPLGIPVYNAEGVIIKANRRFEEIMGYSSNELIGKKISEVTHPEDIHISIDLLNKLFSKQEPVVKVKKRNLKKNGDIVELEITAVLVQSCDGESFVFSMSEDITEKSASKDVLEASKKRFQTLFEIAPVGIPITDEKGRFLNANQKFIDMLGYSLEELKLLSFVDITHYEDLAESLRQFDEMKRGEIKIIDFIKRYVKKDGSLLFGHIYVVPSSNSEDRTEYFAMLEDLTDKINTERNLKEVEQIFTTILQNVSMGVSLVDENGIIFQSMGSLMERAEFKTLFSSGCEIKNALSEYEKEIQSSSLGNKVEFVQSGQVEDKPWALQHFIVPNEARGKGTIDITIDVTDLTEENRRIIQERAVELKRYNEEIKELSQLASHNFREPLNKIQSELRKLEENQKFESDDRTTIKQILGEVNLMHLILDNLKRYFQIQNNDRYDDTIDTNKLVDDVKRKLADLLQAKGVRITLGYLPQIKGNSLQLTQVFVQLVANAIKFSANKIPMIHLSAEAWENGFLFKVSDNGEGFSEVELDQAFKIFKEFQQEGRHHGVGLPLVKKIIENHKGKIWISSEKGKGATIYFSIPNAEINNT